jgi:NADH oxidase (H2O2-forming)
MGRKIVIIGCNAAAINAANAARKTDREAEITMVTAEKYPAYSRCGIPYVLAGEIPKFEDLIVFPPSHYKLMKIDLRTETVATSVDPNMKVVQIQQKDSKPDKLSYDSLILATGASPFVLPVKGRELPGVFTIRSIEDGAKIREAMEEAKNAVVIGAGFIGLETAHAFVEKGINTTIIEMMPHIMPTMFDKDMADIAMKRIEEHGVNVALSTRVTEITGEKKVTGVKAGEKYFPAEIVIMATGVRPNVDIARSVGCELGITRAIKVNSRMETTVPSIYAAGDCVESLSIITKQPCLIQLGTNAVRQGKVAGINAAGGYATFPGTVCSAVSKMFNIQVGAAGITETQARSLGLKTISGTVEAKTRAEYFPGAKDIRVKIVVEAFSTKVIGGQLIGGEEVTQRVNMISFAIMKEATALELSQADTAYAPPLCETWEALALAAEVASMRLKRLT